MSIISQGNCKLSPYSKLDGLTKTKCSRCGKRRMYFCYDCRLTLPGVFSPQVKVVLVFPSPSAVSIEEFVRVKGPIKRLIVLDCTWFQVHMMQKIPEIQGEFKPQHNVDESGLATIEAIYYALREYQEYGLGRPYQGEFDDLLYWFFHTQQHVNRKQQEYCNKKLDLEQ
ncbi:DTW domain protein [Necator americanus]|uniref:tRNA-uridine aminocarboxypropyltransferase 1 n=1 Tax=Necator americanus TaxID=51031 RepID=W2SGQ0_NECAM|nr:DTW domain protein [Necator americanus]ETN68799.1 DTW domain protein [Necator americanus]